jgi:hypothetical protein
VISCDLVPIKEHEGISKYSEGEAKRGRYHGSMFWNLPGFGSSKWVIAARILVSDNIPLSTPDEEIVEGCMEFLNTPPPRKKFQRRVRNLKYGQLTLYSGKVLRKQDGVYISALIVVEQRNSKHFWGKGYVGGK